MYGNPWCLCSLFYATCNATHRPFFQPYVETVSFTWTHGITILTNLSGTETFSSFQGLTAIMDELLHGPAGQRPRGPMGWGILKVSVASNKPVHTKCCPTMSKVNVFNCSEWQLSKFGWKGCRHSLILAASHYLSLPGHSVSHSVICTKSDIKGFGDNK